MTSNSTDSHAAARRPPGRSSWPAGAARVEQGPAAAPPEPPDGEASRSWTVVLPLKGGANAKSRLGAPAELATAIALDCLDAVLAAPGVGEVLVVTPDPALGALTGEAGAAVRLETGPGRGLPAAIADGLAQVQGRCAVLLGDLPALRPEDLATALRRAGALLGTESAPPPMVFVPDAEGSGTVLLTALRPAAMRPAFGPGSAAAHQDAGALRLDADLPRLRRDVDTRDDLRTALALGVGARTRAVLAVLSLPWPELVDNPA